jgi:general secretion pathway protein K
MTVARKRLLNNRGIALITVLLIVSILIAVAVELNRSSRAEIYAAANISDGIKLTYVAKSGFYAGSALLVNFPHDYVSLSDEWARAGLLSVKSHSYFPDGFFVVNIEDEAGKIPLHKLVNGSAFNSDIREILIRLLALPEFGLDDRKASDIVDAIKDWIDADEEVTSPGGAESSYYASLDPPYTAKNFPLDCIEELLMIKGITKELLAGTGERPGLAQYLTIYGDGYININTAPKMVLRALSPNISSDIAGKMDEYRRTGVNNLSNTLWYQKVPGLEAVTIKASLITTKSSYFKISSSGKLNNMARQISGVVKISAGLKSFQVLSWRLD